MRNSSTPSTEAPPSPPPQPLRYASSVDTSVPVQVYLQQTQTPFAHPMDTTEEGDPGRGGRQDTRPRAGQLGGPASRSL
eukprot:611693-Prorocentrum_minimum.AAC.1